MSHTNPSSERRQFFKRSLVVAAGATALSTFGTIQSAAAASATVPKSPALVARFLISNGSTSVAAVQCTGIGSRNTIEAKPAAAGTPNTTFPGDLQWLPVTVTIADLHEQFWIDWRNSVEQGRIMRLNVTITALDNAGNPIAVWSLSNAWPSVVVFQPNEVGFMKQITLVHEGVSRLK